MGKNSVVKKLMLRGVSCAAIVALGLSAAAPASLAATPQPGWVQQQPACRTLTMTAAGGPAPTGDVMVLRYVGSANYEMAYKGTVILFDAQYQRDPPARPIGVTQQELKKVNAIYIGHGHFDHMSEGPFIAEQTNAPMYGGWPTTAAGKKMGLPDRLNITVKNGDIQKYPGFTIETILAHHSDRTAKFSGDTAKAWAAMQQATNTAGSPEIKARDMQRGSMDPHVLDEGTMAYLVTFDNGYKFLMLDSSGPITDGERALMQRIHTVDLASVAYQGFYVAARQIEATLPLVELFKPAVFLPNHHDETAGSFPDMATYPLFMAIRDKMPATRSISPLYRTPVCVDIRTKDVFVGETYTWPSARN